MLCDYITRCNNWLHLKKGANIFEIESFLKIFSSVNEKTTDVNGEGEIKEWDHVVKFLDCDT